MGCKIYSSMHDLPSEILPDNLMLRQREIIPSPPFDLSHQLPSQRLDVRIATAWEQVAASSSLFIAHALSLASQRRVLEAYFINTEMLTAEQLIKYSPFTVLSVRQLISGTLVTFRDGKYKNTTRNGMGFLLKVPSCCLHTVSLIDANSPREKLGVSQAEFRKLILKEGKESSLSLNQSYIHLTPDDLLSSNRSEAYNEVAFIPRTLNPDKAITLCGIFLDETNLNFDFQKEKGDPALPDYYFRLMYNLSDLLSLPIVKINTSSDK